MIICSTNIQSLFIKRKKEKAKHIHLTSFHWRCGAVQTRRTCLKTPNQYSKKSDFTLESCTTIQKTPSEGIVQRRFAQFEGTKKFYYVHCNQKCIKYPFDSRAHLKPVHCLSFKPFNDIIMIVCKFRIGLCCLRSYST